MPKLTTPDAADIRLRWFLPVCSLVLALLLFASWRAGQEAGGLEEQQLSAQLTQLSQKVATTQFALEQQREKTKELEQALKNSGKSGSLDAVSALRQQLSQTQAELGQYKAILERQQERVEKNSQLLEMLTNPGVRIVALKRAEPADSVAYAFVLDNTKLLFVGSQLPKLAEKRVYQLWLVRKQDPKFVSAAVFIPDGENRALIPFYNSSGITGISLMMVTEEPDGGSDAPTGAKILQSEDLET